MRKDVIIQINGCPKYDDADGEVIELKTAGRLYRKNGSYYIMYKESELTGMEGITTTLKVEDKRVTLMRNGMYPTQMIFEKGQRHFGIYNTEFGSLTIAVSARDVRNSMTDSGGDLFIDYSIEVDHVLTGENLFKIQVKEAGELKS
ncbi:MAG: DUF1934 domain-containing protein [Clostridiaceae bacterium]|nr:DUF1934 domain-containing protein [Clostridiaceae bacterium]MDD6273643.1 DUF1934 domain-containing protein [Clostridiaceae bacterium]